MKKYSSYDLTNGEDGYKWSLEQAGVKVLAFETFGSYQGDWLAKVEYKGKIGWIKDYYGSCSVCDAFQAECGWEDKTKTEWKKWCKQFAKQYIENIKTYDEILKEVSENVGWDVGANYMVNFVKNNK